MHVREKVAEKVASALTRRLSPSLMLEATKEAIHHLEWVLHTTKAMWKIEGVSSRCRTSKESHLIVTIVAVELEAHPRDKTLLALWLRLRSSLLSSLLIRSLIRSLLLSPHLLIVVFFLFQEIAVAAGALDLAWIVQIDHFFKVIVAPIAMVGALGAAN